MNTAKKVIVGSALSVLAVVAYQWGNANGRTGQEIQLVPNAFAAGNPPKASPVKAHNRDFYAPNSEDLAPDEMRLIACGTGMPTSRPKQAASTFREAAGTRSSTQSSLFRLYRRGQIRHEGRHTAHL